MVLLELMFGQGDAGVGAWRGGREFACGTKESGNW